MATHRGFDVLELEPDRGVATGEDFERKVFVMDSITGAREGDAVDVAPASVRDFRWLAFNRTEAKERRDFIDARKGRAVPCWFPAWEEDLTLATDHAPGALTLVILSMGYTLHMFPGSNTRRHLAIRVPGGTFYYRKVGAAIDNGNGTETLTLEEPVPVTMPSSGTLVAFLHFARMDADEVEIEWVGQFSECVLRTRDLPTEVPA